MKKVKSFLTIDGEIDWKQLPPGSQQELGKNLNDMKAAMKDIICFGGAFVENPTVRSILLAIGYKEFDPNTLVLPVK